MRVGVITMLAATLAGPGQASAQDGLRRDLEDLVATYRGVAGIAVRNLATSESVSLRGDETFPSASLIKVAILVTLLDEVHNGRMRLDERTTMVARDRVGGSGVLQHLASGTALTLEDLAWLMITLSDNTATNLLLDKLDVKTTWDRMEALGLPHSTATRDVMYPSNTATAMSAQDYRTMESLYGLPDGTEIVR